MWFTKNFRAIWWFVLVLCLTYIIWQRLGDIEAGTAKPLDFLLIIVWLGICLGPLFAEIELPGIKLKQKIEELKEKVTEEVASLRSEIRNTIDVRSSIAPNISFNTPPPDYKLGDLEQQVRSLVDSLQSQGYAVHGGAQAPSSSGLSPSDQTMFVSRRDIEIELRALAAKLDEEPDQRRFAPVSRLVWLLTQNGLIDKNTANLIREVYSVCSLAIHGEPVSEKQAHFVENSAPELISALRAIRERDV
nr:hypothetical protein [Pseudomonas chengduensis]